ncbi:MAG TPA: EAL domain-containing protein [Rubrobacter sp.]|nr:EAL domain-containing protein [Rubrobacter sp.]
MAQRASVRVLLVEDNPGDARLVEILLSETGQGFDVKHVGTLGEALDELDRPPFEVVLLDLSLPDSAGLDTVERMRRAAPQLPLVVLSGRDDEEVALQALQSGAEDYLVKGQESGDLISRSIRYSIERKNAEDKLARLAQYDPLTNLANRALFHDRLEHALARAERREGMLALLFLDLDRFKAVNDTLGHVGGDALLKQVGDRISARIRESDTVARLGGDEFAIIIEDVVEARDAARVAEDLVKILSEPFIVNGHEIPMGVSIGIAVSPPSKDNRLLKDADAAMYRAKREGGNNHQFYTEEMNVQASERLMLERDLRYAMDRDELLLHYQPQVDLATGDIVGAEALLRWRHHERGLVSPADFIPVLEETGHIVSVGEWVLEEASRQASVWQDSGFAPVRVAVNLSARQLGRGGLMHAVGRALEVSGLDPECLELEITETLLVEDSEAGLRSVELLKKAVSGLRISIDDFGTGYSSLYRLKTLPIDRLKIDRAFIGGVMTDPEDSAITATVISLAHELNLQVTAEGVETPEQLAFLRERGCDEAQGFYFSRPLPAHEFVRLLDGSRQLICDGSGR